MIGPLAYIGGKNRLAARLINLFPEHKTYVEPFCGGAQVFFHKEPSKVEILNDLNEDIFNFLRVCQLHHEELIRYLRYSVVSRRWFDLLEKTAPETLTDIQRAARFFFLQKNCYGGLVTRHNFCASVQDHSNYNPAALPDSHHPHP
jgi:DNA adenine methylase